MFTPEETVAQLKMLGCAMDLATYKAFVMAVATVTDRGRHDREAEKDITGTFRPQIDGKTGKCVQQDNAYAAEDVARQRRLRSSLDEHVKLCYAANRWVFESSKASEGLR